ncbi:hypothetical protein [Streptomyces roseolilacinus]|uniref:hypothetical protein n=1 Tax=Streptomyces roseolilacinus TaxID=66904 RepID=UPI00381EE1DA
MGGDGVTVWAGRLQGRARSGFVITGAMPVGGGPPLPRATAGIDITGASIAVIQALVSASRVVRS